MLNPYIPPYQTYRSTVNRIGWTLMIFLAFFNTITAGAELVFTFVNQSNFVVRAIYSLVSSAAYVAPFLLAAAFFSKDLKKNGDIRLRQKVKLDFYIPGVFPLLVLAGLGINFAAAYLNSFFCEAIGYTSSALIADVSGYDIPGTVIFYMTTAIAPAFAEEFLFRGVVFANLRPFGKWQAVLVSAMTFAFMHQNLAQLFYTFICGILLALMYEWTGSIWCSIIFHLFNNQISVLSQSLFYSFYSEGASLAISIWDLVIIAIGVICVVILAVYARLHRRQDREARDAHPGFFGATTAAVETWDHPISRKEVKLGLRSPGMIVFCIITLSSIVLTYLMVLLLNLGGGI